MQSIKVNSTYKMSLDGMNCKKYTLTELLVVLVIIVLIGAGISGYIGSGTEDGKIRQTAAMLESFEISLKQFYQFTGSYPQNSGVGKEPKDRVDDEILLSDFLFDFKFSKGNSPEATLPIGGSIKYDTSGGQTDPNIYLDIKQTPATEEMMKKLDAMIDDGVLSTGRFRKSGSTYTLIIKSDKKNEQ
ncbi:MAG: hypothetical protein ACRC37_07305 [Lentisphaeria bacterium]